MLGLLTKHLAPQIWELTPQNVGKYKALNEFKTKIKSWYLIIVRVGSAKPA